MLPEEKAKRTLEGVLIETGVLVGQLSEIILGPKVVTPYAQNNVDSAVAPLKGVVSMHIDILQKINDDLRMVIQEAHLLK